MSNIGECKSKPKYVCDKCGQTIPYVYRKGFAVNKHYKQKKYDYSVRKEFDLCDNCEKKLKEWLKIKEIQTSQEILNNFPIWKEHKQ